ncbi:glycosyltransferase family 2 protein [Flavobacterium nackdongense]|uniref:Glycosyltransferase family 2 protein n=1 Tax=Flavobacterium nackdongense TaxID=2547394 RepID=A0A4P6YAC6_9FLAO|nr:glycosyltransferase family A protein [Flavobacterium nackdongense]QBN20071.1 glycosyltransferase family 2 protein [Flavobacterium nackdongense]
MSYFSIIIPLYNKEKFIQKTLKSVLSQTFTDFEIIIVNDGSTDKSEEKVLQNKEARIQYYYKENGGVSSARNFGIKKANSEYLAFIDADDYWYPTFLEEMFQNIKLHTKLNVFSSAIEIETSKKIIPATYSIQKTASFEIVNYFSASKKRTVLCSSSAVFHKSVFEHIGHFDLRLKSGEDTDMWIRIGLVYPILFSWKILARYVYDDKSLSKNHKISIESLDFSKYDLLEKSNLGLKKFLDLNRFSLAIKSKIIGDKDSFQQFYKAIDFENLTLKKRLLLQLPTSMLKLLIAFQLFWANLGFGNSFFK